MHAHVYMGTTTRRLPTTLCKYNKLYYYSLLYIMFVPNCPLTIYNCTCGECRFLSRRIYTVNVSDIYDNNYIILLYIYCLIYTCIGIGTYASIIDQKVAIIVYIHTITI